MAGVMEKVRSYQDLEVWQRAMDLAETIHTLTQHFPKAELYGLTSQLRRAATSVPSNIAEGSCKRSTKEFMRFVNIASGSIAEIETQLMLAARYGYVSSTDLHSILQDAEIIGRMLTKLHQSLSTRLQTQTTSHAYA